MRNSNFWVIIPAYNEGKNIGNTIRATKKYAENIIVVDDGSKDNTYKVAKKGNVFVLKHIVNLGKGAALKTGCDFAIKNKAQVIIALDADAQHDPKEIPRFIRNIKKNDIIFGYRKLTREMPAVLKFGNWFINKTIKLLYGVEVKDSQCGYRAFTSKAYKKIRWRASDYSIESEMITKISKHNLKYDEIPIQTIYPNKYKGTTVFDGVKIVLNMFLWKIFNSR